MFQEINADIDYNELDFEDIKFLNIRLRRRFVMVKYVKAWSDKMNFNEEPSEGDAFTHDEPSVQLRGWKIKGTYREINVKLSRVVFNVHESTDDRVAARIITALLGASAQQNQYSPYPMPTLLA